MRVKLRGSSHGESSETTRPMPRTRLSNSCLNSSGVTSLPALPHKPSGLRATPDYTHVARRTCASGSGDAVLVDTHAADPHVRRARVEAVLLAEGTDGRCGVRRVDRTHVGVEHRPQIGANGVWQVEHVGEIAREAWRAGLLAEAVEDRRAGDRRERCRRKLVDVGFLCSGPVCHAVPGRHGLALRKA